MQHSNSIANAMIVFCPLVLLAFTIVVLTPLFATVAISLLYIAGISLLLASKFSQIRDGAWFRFGPGELDSKNRRRYFAAYSIIAIGITVNLTSLILLT